MNPREQDALRAILASKNCRDICPDTVERIFLGKLPLYKSLKEADKSARGALHQITGAFMTPEEIRLSEQLAGDYARGKGDALEKVLLLHASTRERIHDYQALYAQVFSAMGGIPQTVLDLACGLNPIALGALGVPTVTGIDIQGGAVRAVNAWSSACGWSIQAHCSDLLCDPVLPSAELALLMKLLPLMERQRPGHARKLLEECPASMLLVTFPTRTLGGRNVGMEGQYAAWMEKNLPAGLAVVWNATVGTELCYLLERRAV